MNSDQRIQLNKEQARGSRAEHAKESFISPFVAEKRLVLFEAFQEVSIEDTDKLLEIKRQLIAINALETEIQTIIDTGNMAKKALAEQENEE